MKYITGQHALNLPCLLLTCGDWHTSALQWERLNLLDTDNHILGNYGIELNKKIPEHNETYAVANHIRAIIDLLITGKYTIAQGMKEDFICNEDYTQEIFEKVIILKEQPNWNEINNFMSKEYKMKWVNYVRS